MDSRFRGNDTRGLESFPRKRELTTISLAHGPAVGINAGR